MLPYFYHLKFELYPTSSPTTEPTTIEQNDAIWLPPSQADVFDNLPSHPVPGEPDEQESPSSPNHVSGTDRGEAASPGRLVTADGIAAHIATSPRPTEKDAVRQWLKRTRSDSPPSSDVERKIHTAVTDWRFGRVSIRTLDLTMAGESSKDGAGSGAVATAAAAPSLGPSLGGTGTPNKAEYLPIATKNTEMGWGVVHFYREGDPMPSVSKINDGGQGSASGSGSGSEADCSTLCIPAVPAYMSPGDFLGFVGDKWRNHILHCRLVMTSNLNKYLALIKFRDGELAKKWRREMDGKVFNTMEPQVCHVVFIRNITFETPSQVSVDKSAAGPSATISNTLKPFPPPTPNLIELPTCPVCLERMDDTNGLMTIPCSHVFHCTCLKNWQGAGCPVCRFTNASPEREHDASNPYSQPFGSAISNLCSICDSTDDLWICLICGHVGCGRYKGGHAKDHWKETAHSFALELETQHVWDYAGDMWVHRLIRDKGDGKVVELPSRNAHSGQQQQDEDVVPRAKLDNIGYEYMQLLTSQLESQRAYFEGMMNKAVDKASVATAAAESSAANASAALQKLSIIEEKYKVLTDETIPQLERDLERESKKATKSQDLSRTLTKLLQEEKSFNEGMVTKVQHLNKELETAQKQLEELKVQNEDLQEMNRDLSLYISGQAQLKEMESKGQLEEGEAESGTASVPDKKGKRRARK